MVNSASWTPYERNHNIWCPGLNAGKCPAFRLALKRGQLLQNQHHAKQVCIQIRDVILMMLLRKFNVHYLPLFKEMIFCGHWNNRVDSGRGTCETNHTEIDSKIWRPAVCDPLWVDVWFRNYQNITALYHWKEKTGFVKVIGVASETQYF